MCGTLPRCCFASDLDLPATDEEIYAIDATRVIRGEEQHGVGDLLGLAYAAGGYLPMRKVSIPTA